MSVSFFTHQGKSIMFADYRECDSAKKQLELLDDVAAQMNAKKDVRLLVDYSGIVAGPDYMGKVKAYGNTVFKERMLCSAVLGITGLKKILFNGYNIATGARNVKSFDDRGAALDWLASYSNGPIS